MLKKKIFFCFVVYQPYASVDLLVVSTNQRKYLDNTCGLYLTKRAVIKLGIILKTPANSLMDSNSLVPWLCSLRNLY